MNPLFEKIKDQKAPTFVSVKGYENKQGEISNYVINLGFDYGKMVDRDIQKLENASFEDELLEKARVTLLKRLLKNKDPKTQSNQSKGQQDAYYNPCKGLKFHIESGTFYFFGQKIRKKVLRAVEYKPKNSRPLTIAQNKVKKELNLSSHKLRQFKVQKCLNVVFRGDTWELLMK